MFLLGCIGFWCPCMLYSRTRHRLKTAPNSNLNDFSNCNLHCCAFCALAPVSCESLTSLSVMNITTED